MRAAAALLPLLAAWLHLLPASAHAPAAHTVTVRPAPALDWRREDAAQDGGRVCAGVDVRNSVRALRVLRGCRVVEGNLMITLVYNAQPHSYDNYSFPELIEITGYMMLYQVEGLRTLGQLFPRLAVIRGNTLFENYALIVFNAFHLEALGLRALVSISRGGVRIEENPELCFAETVDWPALGGAGSRFIGKNKDASACKSCAANCTSGLCWSEHTCIADTATVAQPACHPLCLAGCSGPAPTQCEVCRGVRLNGECLDKCPSDRLEYRGLHCLTEAQCRAMDAHWPFDGACVEKCPQSFVQVTRADNLTVACEACGAACPCGGARIDSIAAAQHLRGCVFINGSLEIEVSGGRHEEAELAANLGQVADISGSLRVVRSLALTSLAFLRSLRSVRGLREVDAHSLVVHSNQNLRALWPEGAGPRTLGGPLFFHDNPRLCVADIERLSAQAGLDGPTKHEVSLESNGDEVACHRGDRDEPILAAVTIVLSRSALLEFTPPPPHVADPGTRYLVYLAEAATRDITLDDERSACAADGDPWKVTYVAAPGDVGAAVLHPLTRLQPHTQYAFYLTMATTRAYTARQSRVQYFRTLPDRPTAPRIVSAVSPAPGQLELAWDAPSSVNGDLENYVVSGVRLRDEPAHYDQRDYCAHPAEGAGSDAGGFVVARQRRVFDCCGREQLLEIRDPADFEARCAPAAARAHSKETARALAKACADFFYSCLATHLPPPPPPPQQQQRRDDAFPAIVRSAASPRRRDGDAGAGAGGGERPVWGHVDPAAPAAPAGRPLAFVRSLDANTTRVRVRDLLAFGKYAVSVSACRRAAEGEGAGDARRCSVVSVAVVRTRPAPAADDIDAIRVGVAALGVGAVRVTWPPPPRPNGVVVAFDVEYRRRDADADARPASRCVTRVQHKRGGGGVALERLGAGAYALRVRAVTLAGAGAWSEPVAFSVAAPAPAERRDADVWLGVVLGAATLCGGVATLAWCARRRRLLRQAATAGQSATAAGYEEDQWEVARDRVTLGRPLGRGSFGLVFEGSLLSDQDVVACAVKTIRAGATPAERADFLKEASVMKAFGAAQHVVRLLGVVSRGWPPLVVMELMSAGDLKTYLRAQRAAPGAGPTAAHMAAQVADGMCFLAARKFVHRDLAARNCLLDGDLTVKVADFGMTRDLDDADYYRKQTRGALPVRWMSPESLSDGVFSSQSDVWSFGVLLWELATLAAQPYQGLANEQVVSLVLGGGKLQRPAGCPDLLHELMAGCWAWRPDARPDFPQLLARLQAPPPPTPCLASFQRDRCAGSVQMGAAAAARWEAATAAGAELRKLPPPPRKVRAKVAAARFDNVP